MTQCQERAQLAICSILAEKETQAIETIDMKWKNL